MTDDWKAIEREAREHALAVRFSFERVRALLVGVVRNAEATGCPAEHVRYVREVYAPFVPPPRRSLARTPEEIEAFKRDCIPALRQLARRLNRTPTKRDIRAAHDSGMIAKPGLIQRLFGSLELAMIAAGLEPRMPGHSVEDAPGSVRDRSTRKHPATYRRLRSRGWVKIPSSRLPVSRVGGE